jgi:hypothetical protein
MRRSYLGSASLLKLAKHLAVLACLGIVLEASGRFAVGENGIFLLVVLAALLHSVGRTLLFRLPPPLPLGSARLRKWDSCFKNPVLSKAEGIRTIGKPSMNSSSPRSP